MAASSTNSTNDLVPKEALQEIDELNKRVNVTILSFVELLKQSAAVNKEFGKVGNTCKKVGEAIQKFHDIEKEVIKVEKEQTQILAQKNKIFKEVIASNSQQVEQTQGLTEAIKEETGAIQEQTEAVKDNTEDVGRFIISQEALRQSAQDLADRLLEVKERLSYRDILDNVSQGIITQKQALSALSSELKDLEGWLRSNQSSFDIGSITEDQYYENIQLIKTELDATQKAYDELKGSQDAVITSTQQLANEVFSELERSLQNNIKSLIDAQNAQKATRAEISALDKQYKDTPGADAYLQKKAALIALEKNQATTVKNLNTEVQLNLQLVNSAPGSYENLAAQYGLLKMQINALEESFDGLSTSEGKNTEAEKVNTEQKRKLEAQAKRVYEQMDKLQRATGKHQLNVGNYDAAVKDLTRTVSLLDPRLGAIITKLQNVSSIKKTWITVNNQLVKSLGVTARAATLMQAAVVGLVVGGILLAVSAYKKWREEQKQAAEAQKEFQNVMLEGEKNAQQEITRLNLLYNASTDVSRSMNERLKAAGELQKQYPEYLGNLTKEEILAGKGADAYDKLSGSIIKSAQARAASDKITENSRRILDIDHEKAQAEIKILELEAKVARQKGSDKSEKQARMSYLEDGLGLALRDAALIGRLESEISNQNKAIREGQKEREKLTAQNKELAGTIDISSLIPTNTKDIQKQIDAEKKAYQDLISFRMNLEAEASQRILNDNKQTYEDRLGALQIYIKNQEDSIRQSADFQLKDTTLTESQRRLIIEKANAELEKLDQERTKSGLALWEDYVQKQTKLVEEGTREQLAILSEEESNEQAILVRKLQSGIISRQEYEQQKTEITRRYIEERHNTELDQLKGLLQISGLTEEQRLDIQRKIDALRIQHTKQTNDQIISDAERAVREQEKLEEDLARKRKQLAREVVSFINTAYDAQVQKQLNRIDKQKEANSEYFEEQTDLIDKQLERGIISQEAYDAKKEELAQAEKEREAALEQERKEVLKRQAVYEKAQSIASIGISTAQAVMKQLAATPLPIGAPLVKTIIALGAAQAATVLATPIPEYRYGTDNHPGGPAWVGDGGRAELIAEPSGKVYKSPARATLMDLPAGTVVYPDFNKEIQKYAFVPTAQEKERVYTYDSPYGAKQTQLLHEGNQLRRAMWTEQRKERMNSRYNNSLYNSKR